MAVYVVSYDLKQGDTGHDYQDLYDAFDAIESHRILLSVYLVSTTSSASQLKEYLLQHMDAKDRIWVSRVHPNVSAEYGFRVMAGTKEWLRKHPPS